MRRNSKSLNKPKARRSPNCHAGGRGFESRRSRHLLLRTIWKKCEKLLTDGGLGLWAFILFISRI